MWDFPIIQPQGGPKTKRKRYSEEQIIALLKEHEAGASVLLWSAWRNCNDALPVTILVIHLATLG